MNPQPPPPPEPIDLIARIPHRPPMLLLDHAILDPDGRVIARRHITRDHPFVHDGFLLPLALIEMLSQTAACGAAAQLGDRTIHRGMLVSVRDLVFHRPAAIGDTLTLCGRQERSVGALSLWHLHATIDAGLVAEGRMAFHLE